MNVLKTLVIVLLITMSLSLLGTYSSLQRISGLKSLTGAWENGTTTRGSVNLTVSQLVALMGRWTAAHSFRDFGVRKLVDIKVLLVVLEAESWTSTNSNVPSMQLNFLQLNLTYTCVPHT